MFKSLFCKNGRIVFLSLVACAVVSIFSYAFLSFLLDVIAFDNDVLRSLKIAFLTIQFGIFATLFISFVFGIPSYLFLKRRGYLGWKSAMVTGFLVGFILIFLLDMNGSGYQTLRQNGMDLITDGQRTMIGWMFFFVGKMMTGLSGAMGGLCAWAVWKRFSSVQA